MARPPDAAPGYLRSHEAAADVLREAVPGAVVRVRRPHLRHWAQNNTERSRVYEIWLPQDMRQPVLQGAYSLPIEPEVLAQNARDELNKRIKTLSARKGLDR